MSTATIHAAVSRIVSSGDVSEPRQIATLALDALTDEQKLTALEEVAASYVADILRRHRNSVLSEMSPRPIGTPSRSAKVAAYRDWWQRVCETRWSIGGAWKPLAEMTSADLLTAAAERRQLATENLNRAELLEKLAARMGELGVDLVGHLTAAQAASAGWSDAA